METWTTTCGPIPGSLILTHTHVEHEEMATRQVPGTGGHTCCEEVRLSGEAVERRHLSACQPLSGCGSKFKHQGITGFSPWFHLPGFHFAYPFLTLDLGGGNHAGTKYLSLV